MRNNILYLLLYLCLHSFTSKAQNPLTEYVETPDSIRNAKTPGAWYFQAGAVSQQFRFTGQRKEVAIMKFPQTVQPSIAIGRELIFAVVNPTGSAANLRSASGGLILQANMKTIPTTCKIIQKTGSL